MIKSEFFSACLGAHAGQPRLPPVAGILMSVDKVSIIAPYLSAALLIAALITTFSFRNRTIKKSKEALAD